jgi:phage terminase large subunit
MIFKPFRQQREFMQSTARIRGAFAGKRGGKTEVGAIEAIIHAETQPGYATSSVDEYIGIILAPTSDMLRRLSLKKFLGFAKPFAPEVHKTFNEIRWHNGSLIYGLSADRPERMEGIKASWVWCDESFQMDEQIFTEAMARVADTRGRIWCTGSLGVQYTNPKQHWVYKHFKQKPLADSACFEWGTIDNPHFPREEIDRLKDTLDPVTFRQMFEISWDVQGTNLVFQDFTEANLITNYQYNPRLQTFVSIDWGWNHPMSALYFQYDQSTDTVYLFDEIHGSKMTLEVLWEKMKAKPYRVTEYFCDIAGLQTREQTALSNIQWFKQPPRNIHFRYRTAAVAHTIAIMRSYICNMKGQRRFYVDQNACPRFVDEMRNYSYKERNGEITEETNQVADDAIACARYFFVNKLDFTKQTDTFTEMNRWKLGG